MKKQKKIKKKLIIKLIISIIMLILSLICFKYINDLDILPNKYLYLVLIMILVLNILATLFIFIKGIICKIFSIILYIILGLISILGIKYAGNTQEFLDKGFNNNIEYSAYNIIVPKNSSYTNIKELNNTTMGYFFIDIDNDKYLDEVKKNVNVNLQQLGLGELYEGLLDNKINSIIINEGYIDLLESEYSDFSEKTKILETIKIEKKEEQIVEKITELNPINIYLSGSDSRSGIASDNSLSDVNMIITINPNINTILLTNIPRDYYVKLHGTTGYKDKLTHAGLYGINMSMTTIEDFMEIELDYFIKIGFNSVIKLVDLVGGIDVYSDISFRTLNSDGGAERVYIKKGMNHLNGAQALSYVRERFAYSNGDIHRGQNQQQVIEAVLNKITANKSLLLKYDSLLNSFSKLYKTNIPKELITLLIKQQLENMNSWKTEKQTLLGYDGMNQTYSWPNQQLYVMIPDENSVKNAINKINEVLTKKNKEIENNNETIIE